MVNDSARGYPQHNQKHCSKCGATTIMTCPGCNTPIRGDYQSDGGIILGGTTPAPSFCHQCGVPYPWTAEALDVAREIAAELDGLKDAERQALTRSLDDLIRDTPRTQLAVLQFKKYIARAKGPAASALRDAILPIATEAARKALLGG